MSLQARIAMDACTGDLRVLPYEVLLGILDHLPPADRISTCLVNKYLWYTQSNQGWMDDFRRNRGPEPSWDPPSSTSTQWRPPAQGGLLQLLRGLERDAPGTVHVCPNCEVLHQGPYARSSLYDVRYNSTQGYSDLVDSRGLCAASGSSDWEVRDLFLDGSRSSFPVAEKKEFHTKLSGAGGFAYHRIIRVLLPPAVVLALPSATDSVGLALWTCPFIICSHFVIQVLNTTNVPLTDAYSTIYGDDNNPRSHINTGCGWVLPFDAQNNRVIPSGRVERGGWFKCSGCAATYGVTTHFHGGRGVEVVLDVFHRHKYRSDWRNCWEPAFAMPDSESPSRTVCLDDPKHYGWVFCAPLLVPGTSGISDASLDAAERALREKYSPGSFSFEPVSGGAATCQI